MLTGLTRTSWTDFYAALPGDSSQGGLSPPSIDAAHCSRRRVAVVQNTRVPLWWLCASLTGNKLLDAHMAPLGGVGIQVGADSDAHVGGWVRVRSRKHRRRRRTGFWTGWFND